MLIREEPRHFKEYLSMLSCRILVGSCKSEVVSIREELMWLCVMFRLEVAKV